jgi:hypothetical protein
VLNVVSGASRIHARRSDAGNRIPDENKDPWFSKNDRLKLGCLLLDAITAGDVGFADVVRDAVLRREFAEQCNNGKPL